MTSATAHHYRPELDGLRSVAVLAVVLYHFAVPGFQGGFVGVDVFFVLSGFFIGRLLWVELMETGRVVYLPFLFRRLRRLAPAYFAMIIVVSVVAYQVLLPFEYRFFGKELLASTVYLSNILYFREAGYFDIGSDSKNLLHTWSLSVEEQFYILLPLCMILLARRPQVLVWVLGGIFAVSLAACIVVTQTSSTATFFLFPFRAWELLTGVLMAIFGSKYGFKWSIHAAISWLGIGLILAAIFLMPAGPMFPGALAIVPVLGTALLVLNGGQHNIINVVLSHKVPVFFGLISYSLYLWHWPIMTLSKYISDGPQGAVERALLIALSIVIAWVSWRFVETPFRKGAVGAKPLVAGAAVASAFTLATGALIYVKDGAPGRFPTDVRIHMDAAADFLQDWTRCETPSTGGFAGIEICPIGPDGPPQLLIWGDSHVRAFKEGLELRAWEAEVPALIIWRAGCPPLLGIGKAENSATPAQNAACASANSQIVDALTELPEARTLLYIGRWAYYADGTGVGRDIDNTIDLFPADGSDSTAASQADLLADAFQQNVSTLSRQFDDIFVLRQVPEIANYSSREVARRLAHRHLQDATDLMQVTQADALARAQSADAVLQSLPVAASVIDPWPAFCGADLCTTAQEGRSDFFDNNHITNSAARRVRNLFDPVFEAAGGGAN